jgi:Cu-Zn family superoxide dismutase
VYHNGAIRQRPESARTDRDATFCPRPHRPEQGHNGKWNGGSGAVMRALLGIGVATALSMAAAAGPTASARIIDTNGRPAGEAHFKAAPHGVLIEIRVTGLQPGPHAVLIHDSGTCDPKTGFASAGPVLDFELGRAHGYFAKGGPKPGDLPLQFAAADGTLHASLYSTAISLGDGKRSIFGRNGVSIIVHAASDDYLSQPDGRAGARLACGTIIRAPKKHK